MQLPMSPCTAAASPNHQQLLLTTLGAAIPTSPLLCCCLLALINPNSHPHRFGRLPSIFSEMQREMDALTRSFGLFDDSDFLMAPFRSSPLLADMQRHFDMPAMEAKMPLLRLATDIEEDEGAFTIKADIPGM